MMTVTTRSSANSRSSNIITKCFQVPYDTSAFETFKALGLFNSLLGRGGSYGPKQSPLSRFPDG